MKTISIPQSAYAFNKRSHELARGASVRQHVTIETEFGPAEFFSFDGLIDGKEHIALVYKGSPSERGGVDVPLIRVHSECLTGDVFTSARCDCGEQLKEAQRKISREGGVILYLRQEGRGIGLYNKLDAYKLQDQGHDTFEANRLLGLPDDMRSYRVAAQMLNALDLTSVRMLTNNPDKALQLQRFGIAVDNVSPTDLHLKKQNVGYLRAKAVVGGHSIDLKKLESAK